MAILLQMAILMAIVALLLKSGVSVVAVVVAPIVVTISIVFVILWVFVVSVAMIGLRVIRLLASTVRSLYSGS